MWLFFQLQEMGNCLNEKLHMDQGLHSEHFRECKIIKLVITS